MTNLDSVLKSKDIALPIELGIIEPLKPCYSLQIAQTYWHKNAISFCSWILWARGSPRAGQG